MQERTPFSCITYVSATDVKDMLYCVSPDRYEDETHIVKASWLRHKIPSFGFAIQEKPLPGRYLDHFSYREINCWLF